MLFKMLLITIFKHSNKNLILIAQCLNEWILKIVEERINWADHLFQIMDMIWTVKMMKKSRMMIDFNTTQYKQK